MSPLKNPPIQHSHVGFATHMEGGLGVEPALYDGSTGHKAVGKTPGIAFLTKGSAGTDYTLTAPIAGGREVAGDDGLELTIIAQTAYAHVVTVGAGLVNGATNGTLTWTAAVGNGVVLVAHNGKWYTKALNGVAVG